MTGILFKEKIFASVLYVVFFIFFSPYFGERAFVCCSAETRSNFPNSTQAWDD